MSEPPYITIMMLNPVENAIREFESLAKPVTPEEKPLVPVQSDQDIHQKRMNNLVPKQRFTIFIWFMVTMSTCASWFTFTISVPITQHYYGRSFIETAMVFIITPVTMAITLPLVSSLLNRDSNALLSVMIAAFSNALGSAIKCKGSGRDGYLVMLLGHFFISCALALSFVFFLSFRQQYPHMKSKVVFCGAISVGLGNCIGIIAPYFVIHADDSMDETGWKIYKYFISSAVVSIVPLVLIPFSIKEQNQQSTATYQTYQFEGALAPDMSPRNHAKDHNGAEAKSSPVSVTGFLANVSLLFQNKHCCRKIIAVAAGYALFISLFFTITACFPSEAGDKRLMLCFVEICVVVTFLLFTFLAGKFKLEASKLLHVITALIFIASIILFTVYRTKGPLCLLYTLYYLFHATSSSTFAISMHKIKSLEFVKSTEHLMTVVCFAHAIASVLCVAEGMVIWKLGNITLVIMICILFILSSALLHL